MTNSAPTKFVLTLIVILWIALLGFVLNLSILDFGNVGYLGWHLALNSISVCLCASVMLMNSYRRKSKTFEVDWRKIVVILLVVFPLSTLLGYKHDWGLYLVPILWPLFNALFLLCAWYYSSRLISLFQFADPQSRKSWLYTNGVLTALMLALSLYSWIVEFR